MLRGRSANNRERARSHVGDVAGGAASRGAWKRQRQAGSLRYLDGGGVFWRRLRMGWQGFDSGGARVCGARMDSTSWLHPRDELVATMDRIYRYHMTTTSGGNLSILDPDGSIWITPSRVDKGSLQADDIVRMKADGSREGLHPASSEFPFHREIYRRRPDIKAIVHAHPGALVAFSIVRRLPETRVQTHAHGLCGKIAYAAYACPGSQELGDKIAESFAGGADCVMLENHGVVIGGRGGAGFRGVAGGSCDESREGIARRGLRVCAPRLSSAADDQHGGIDLGAVERHGIRDHAASSG
jgi:ribulose-5-phosphate 4-epimerase/fuculose-1-phosphate aldolase